MAYTKEELLKLGVKDISEARQKIVNISIFDNIDDLKIDSNLENLVNLTIDLYLEYLQILDEFSKVNKEQILISFRNIEVIDNHCVERENYDLLKSYNETHHSTAIKYLIKKLITEKGNLNDFIVKKTHEILMRGTSIENEIVTGYRRNNNYFVGYRENNENVIGFFPISYDEIAKSMTLFLSYYNSSTKDIIYAFLKPFIIHGLIAVLQVFEDGNTRLARTFQHVNLFDVTENFFDQYLSLPAIYFSKSYIPYRYEYRTLITNIALSPTYENWRNWIGFNLRRLQDQIFMNEEQLKRTRKI